MLNPTVPEKTPATILAIDPGRVTGWAVFVDGHLSACGTTSVHDAPPVTVQSVALLVIERPVVYPRRSEVPPNDLITLAIEVGRWLERAIAAGVRTMVVEPAQWKGQTPKDVHNRRVLGTLEPWERSRVPMRHARLGAPVLHDHNCIDAIGIGLHTIGRLRPR